LRLEGEGVRAGAEGLLGPPAVVVTALDG